MPSQKDAVAGGPRFDTRQLHEYLQPTTAYDDDERLEMSSHHDAESQEWGDYLEEIEGYEI